MQESDYFSRLYHQFPYITSVKSQSASFQPTQNVKGGQTVPMNRRKVLTVSSAALAMLPAGRLVAEAHGDKTIEMLNKDPEDPKARMVFYPRILTVEQGDAVLFKSVDRGHNSASIDGMIPDGAESWNGRISKDIEVTFAVPGLYGYQCIPSRIVIGT